MAKAAPEQPAEPTLHGATPDFKPTRQEVAAAEVDPAKAIVKSSPADTAPSSTASSSPPSPTSTASSAATEKLAAVDGPPGRARRRSRSPATSPPPSSATRPAPATRPCARRSARRRRRQLAKALLRRPPRLPANVKVPKAKVVNVVPAPSRGGIYPVSVSLLRVGLTSELRLEMEKRKADGWRVTNVLG